MCGITGFIDFKREIAHDEAGHVVQKMARQIWHRGPDAEGTWVDADSGVALGHRRLSIIDLSTAGSQPMLSPSGRHVIVFNGEIYNFQQIRKEIEQSTGGLLQLKGHSDTEIILAAVDAWGIEKSLLRFNGMFAIALWDRLKRTLTLARDRFGEKPLYYAPMNNFLLFGSELKSLRAHPAFSAKLNTDALSSFLRHNYIRGPHSIYQGVYKLPAGTWLQVNIDTSLGGITPRVYWSAHAAARVAQCNPHPLAGEELISHAESVLTEAIGLRMISDVPLGAFLSGGIDSSTVVALMQAQSPQPVKTFTVGFLEAEFNEAEYAKAIAAHLRTDHTELYVTPQAAMEIIPLLPNLYDEPFADISQIPTYLVSKLARESVTVALSGDGGDELFGGYERYHQFSKLYRWFSKVPFTIRKRSSQLLAYGHDYRWLANSMVANSFSGLFFDPSAAKRMARIANLLDASSLEDMYLRSVSHLDNVSVLTSGNSTLAQPVAPLSVGFKGQIPIQEMMLIDTLTYLPDDILVKLDRAAMGVSLEGRVPLLDPYIFEFAWRMPSTVHVRNGPHKQILRDILYRHVPRNLVDRPKRGFSVPIGNWLRGPLQEWAESLLTTQNLLSSGICAPEIVREMWRQHLTRQNDWRGILWNLLTYQTWFAQNRPHVE